MHGGGDCSQASASLLLSSLLSIETTFCCHGALPPLLDWDNGAGSMTAERSRTA